MLEQQVFTMRRLVCGLALSAFLAPAVAAQVDGLLNEMPGARGAPRRKVR